MNILLIEPNALLADQYSGILISQGYKVRKVVDAQEAILSADKQAPDLVIVEPLLSSHSGVEFLYEFRSYAEWQKIPIIILSRVPPHDLGLLPKTQKELNVTALYKSDTTLKKLGLAVEQALS